MYLPGYNTITKLAEKYSLIPISKEIPLGDNTTIGLLAAVASENEQFFLLESAEEGVSWSRYSFLGFHPILRAFSTKTSVTIEKDEEKKTLSCNHPIDVLRDILKEYRSPKIDGFPHFTGGFVGYFGYSFMAQAEKKLQISRNDAKDFDLMLFEDIIAIDHIKNTITVIANMKTDCLIDHYRKATKRIEKTISFIKNALPSEPKRSTKKVSFTCNTSLEAYTKKIEQTKKYIYEGDIFQAVISRRFESDFDGSMIPAYEILRENNPSPYMVYLHMKDKEIISTSPETLVRLENNRLCTFPVAGSRPRGASKEEDERLQDELLHDEKELSEHNMLVDLGRNDLGRISEFSSVEVTKYMDVHKYSKIMHICSQVESVLKNDMDAFDAIEAVLPAGTLSGAPKIRAMEIIEELEDVPRGIYGGALGYIDFNGNMDTCIAIRMGVKENDKVYVQAGGGIVADSVPKTEYEESSNKAKAVIEAIKKSQSEAASRQEGA